MKDKLIRLTVNNGMKESFKGYCTEHDTTMSTVLLDHITTLVENAGKSPAEVKNTAMYCPYCGEDINGQK